MERSIYNLDDTQVRSISSFDSTIRPGSIFQVAVYQHAAKPPPTDMKFSKCGRKFSRTLGGIPCGRKAEAVCRLLWKAEPWLSPGLGPVGRHAMRARRTACCQWLIFSTSIWHDTQLNCTPNSSWDGTLLRGFALHLLMTFNRTSTDTQQLSQCQTKSLLRTTNLPMSSTNFSSVRRKGRKIAVGIGMRCFRKGISQAW